VVPVPPAGKSITLVPVPPAKSAAATDSVVTQRLPKTSILSGKSTSHSTAKPITVIPSTTIDPPSGKPITIVLSNGKPITTSVTGAPQSPAGPVSVAAASVTHQDLPHEESYDYPVIFDDGNYVLETDDGQINLGTEIPERVIIVDEDSEGGKSVLVLLRERRELWLFDQGDDELIADHVEDFWMCEDNNIGSGILVSQEGQYYFYYPNEDDENWSVDQITNIGENDVVGRLIYDEEQDLLSVETMDGRIIGI
jgi:hypothetical protein